MVLLQQLFFILMAGLAGFLFWKKARSIRRNILLGKDENLNDYPERRWRNVLLLALGQKKMFKRPIPAVLHLLVYAGFIIINIEILEIVLDGLSGHHRLFAPLLGKGYGILIGFFEVLALLVLISCIIFWIRRNILHVRRLAMKELNGWPKSDANIILTTEMLLMSLLLVMNASDQVLQSRAAEHYVLTDSFWVSTHLKGFLDGLSTGALVVLERMCWWLHIAGIFAFLNYLPYSKHLHILLAFPNAYYARLTPLGAMKNMKEVQQEVLYMMQPELAPPPAEGSEQTAPHRFGAKDVTDLSWKNLLDAYSCTECGRCTANCPASLTGKKLSPRSIMMHTRDRLEEAGRNRDKNKAWTADGKTLLHDYITVEELRACTTCNACVEACPVSIEPLDIINRLRRYLVMEESNSPQEWNMMFGNMENNQAPWKFSPDERDRWTADIAG
jgi:succinate dehydrogenase/fumarate reductase-like Fe-S protein